MENVKRFLAEKETRFPENVKTNETISDLVGGFL